MTRRSPDNTTLLARAFLQKGHPRMALCVAVLSSRALVYLSISSGALVARAITHWPW